MASLSIMVRVRGTKQRGPDSGVLLPEQCCCRASGNVGMWRRGPVEGETLRRIKQTPFPSCSAPHFLGDVGSLTSSLLGSLAIKMSCEDYMTSKH